MLYFLTLPSGGIYITTQIYLLFIKMFATYSFQIFPQPCVMHLAAVNQKMSLEETLAAATINAAHSIGRSKTHGSIEVGKVADLVIVNAPR